MGKKIICTLLCLLALPLGAGTTQGADIYVAPAGSGDGTIIDPTDLQTALATAAGNGDEENILFLRTGTNAGNFVYQPASGDSDLEIRGGYSSDYGSRTLDPANTILTGAGTGSVLKINDWGTTVSGSILIEGITVRNGDSDLGGGIYAVTRPPGMVTLRHVIIEDNRAKGKGGGCFLASAAPSLHSGGQVVLADTIIRRNHVTGYTESGSAEAGEGDGCLIIAADHTMLTNNLVYGNTGGTANSYDGYGGGLLVLVSNGEVILANNTITANRVYSGQGGGGSGSGGLFLETAEKSWGPGDIRISNTIIHGNHAPASAGTDIVNNISDSGPAADSTVYLGYSDYGHMVNIGGVTPSLEKTIQANPLFSHAPKTLYYLRAGSRCVDSGDKDDPNMPSTDLAGIHRPLDGDGDGIPVPNMGCYEKVVHFPWAMYIPVFTSGRNR
ncbi:MAG TPA: hypothetical protein ENI89_06030 [Desulfobulbus sp.]|nr:hypothetical protein [Desulfobulbus sp.]